MMAKNRRIFLGSTGADRLDRRRGRLSVNSSAIVSRSSLRGAVTGKIGREDDQIGTNNFINCLDKGPGNSVK